MEATGQHIFEFLRSYGYFIMLPLMIVEGPTATIISAMLASLGAFNVLVVLALSVIGDILGDIVLYGLGHRYGISFVRRIGRFVGITEPLVLKMERHFQNHGGKIIFAVKSTTGICWATFVAAGIVKMDFKKFLKYSILGGIAWSGLLVALGYFYGYFWREIRDTIEWIGWAIFILAIATIVFVQLYQRSKSRKMLKEI